MPRWTVFVFFIIAWMLGVFLGGIIEQTTIGDEEVSSLQALLTFNVIDIEWFAQGPWNILPKVTFPWFEHFWDAVLWDFALFEGAFGQFVKFVFWAVTIGFLAVVGWSLAKLIRGGG